MTKDPSRVEIEKDGYETPPTKFLTEVSESLALAYEMSWAAGIAAY